jgi:hypothetical protein
VIGIATRLGTIVVIISLGRPEISIFAAGVRDEYVIYLGVRATAVHLVRSEALG